MSDRPLCQHCDTRIVTRPRGLCYVCFYAPGVGDLYPAARNYSPRGYEPTAEEVERCVAEQMQCLPDWWHGGESSD